MAPAAQLFRRLQLYSPSPRAPAGRSSLSRPPFTRPMLRASPCLPHRPNVFLSHIPICTSPLVCTLHTLRLKWLMQRYAAACLWHTECRHGADTKQEPGGGRVGRGSRSPASEAVESWLSRASGEVHASLCLLCPLILFLFPLSHPSDAFASTTDRFRAACIIRYGRLLRWPEEVLALDRSTAPFLA